MNITGTLIAVAVLLVASVAGLWWRRRNGTLHQAEDTGQDQVVQALLGGRPRQPVTLLQFSSAHCGPCVTARRLCAELAADLDGVDHVEVDVDEHLDAVRVLDIRRTPTVLVVDAGGRVVRRGAGPPDRAGLLTAITAARPDHVSQEEL